MATDNHLPDWDEDRLSLGRPAVMDTPTLIEWIERQLETPEEMTQRLEAMKLKHQIWHENTRGVYSCCFQTDRFGRKEKLDLNINLPNELRAQKQMETYETALKAFRDYNRPPPGRILEY